MDESRQHFHVSNFHNKVESGKFDVLRPAAAAFNERRRRRGGGRFAMQIVPSGPGRQAVLPDLDRKGEKKKHDASSESREI